MNGPLRTKRKNRDPDHAGLQGSLLSDPKAVETWISNLPMANTEETTRRIFRALVKCNRQTVPGQARFRIAELFREPVRCLSESIERYYIDSAFPLSAKNRRAAQLSRELHSELAICYKLFVWDAFTSGKQIDQELMVTAAHRALCALSDIILASSLVYAPDPEKVWQEIHYLYALAAKSRIHKLPAKDPFDETTDNTSISDLYKRILMYSLASPNYLRQRENQLIYRKLPEWAGYVHLGIPADGGGQFVTRLSSDSPPRHLSVDKGELTGSCRLIDARALVQHLHGLAGDEPAKKEKKPLSDTREIPVHLVKHLIQHWSMRPERKFARTRLHFDLKLAIGMPSIHALLQTSSQKKRSAAAGSRRGKEDWLEQSVQRNYERTDPSQETTRPRLELMPLGHETENSASPARSPFSGNDAPAPRAGETGPLLPARIVECRTLNESAGGYCLDWSDPDIQKIRLGELIGIQSAVDANQFGIGIARWLQSAQEQNLQLGMQLIAPNSIVVETRLAESGESPVIHDCLLIPEVKASAIPLSLITPIHSYKINDELWIDDGKSERRIQLTRLLATTGAFSQYQIVYTT